MMRPTHKLVACGVTSTTSAAVGLPVPAAVALTAVAVMTTMWPDRLERPLMLSHRGMTHTWQAIALVPAAVGAFVFAVLAYGHGLLRLIGVTEPPPAVEPAAAAAAGAVLAAGVLVGYLSHLAADACTVGGLKCRDRKVYLLPRPLRVRVGRLSERVFVLLFTAAWFTALWLLVWPDLQR